MEIKTNKNKFRVVIDGKEFFLSMTKLKHQMLVDDLIEMSKESKPTGRLMAEILVSLGLPKEVAEELDEENLIQILKGMAEAKKNLQNSLSSSPS